jgi:hypothetical protein
MPFNNGEVFAGYVIERLLGTGGMGEVYLAQHPRLPRHDALKILSLAATADEEFRARFIREAELAATLWHPHIVGVLDRGEFNGRLWISMDYVDGTDAGRLIRESYPGGMPDQDVLEIVTAVADALDFGHERRLLHRAMGSQSRPATQRLERMVVRGTAHGVSQSTVDPQQGFGTLSFRLVPYDPIDNLPAALSVKIETQLNSVQLADGDEVEVSGVWDGATLDADTIATFAAQAPPKRRSSPPRAESVRDKPSKRRIGRTAAIVALVGVIVLAAGAVVWFTDGFGAWTRPGPIIKPANASVFSPSGAADNPQKAGLAIDGNPDTSWPTVTYTDPVPFPNFVEGEGLMLHLSEPTALSAVTIDLSSTGTEVQIRSSPTETPTKLSDTTELVPTTPLQPGQNRIEVHNSTKTSNVLVWITKLGTTDGQSRTDISEITLQAAA